MFNKNAIPTSIENLVSALHINLSAIFDASICTIVYRFYTDDYEKGWSYHLTIGSFLDEKFNLVGWLLENLAKVVRELEFYRKEKEEIEEYQKKDLENTKKVLNMIYGQKAMQHHFSNQTKLSYNSVMFDSLEDASEILLRLRATIKQHGNASVLDFYYFSGIVGEWDDMNVGWVNLDGAHIVKWNSGKYQILFPKAIKLD